MPRVSQETMENLASFICQFTLFGASTLFFGNHSPKSVKYFWGDMKDAENLNEFLNTLPTEARKKCALCNETLTHIVKSAEVHTGAPTATVTRELANRVNDGAASGDVVSGGVLQDRVRRNEGVKVAGRQNKPDL